jgi:hypothetical protein
MSGWRENRLILLWKKFHNKALPETLPGKPLA